MARLVIKQRKSSKVKVVHVIRHGEAGESEKISEYDDLPSGELT